jgi:cyclopropane-fatty-acyl-phospholipid synthase
MNLTDLAERGLLPDALIRYGIRRLCRERLTQEYAGDWQARKQQRIDALKVAPIAIETAKANEQHYEVPPPFFVNCLGPRLKYSSCFYPTGRESLGEGEDAMLALYGERAGLADGMDILELGCGWGSLTLWMAEHFPKARITAVSNSAPQRQFIEARARERGLKNVTILTRDANVLELPAASFDRVVSIEMFEHLKNYRTLFERIHGWLRPGGALFVHIFCHREVIYPFEVDGDNDWMARYFFTGGQMPSLDTFSHFQEHLKLEQTWDLPGTHYERTSNQWLELTDQNRAAILPVFEQTYGKADAARWLQRWRMFYMACAELFGYDGGKEWRVGHYRFRRP